MELGVLHVGVRDLGRPRADGVGPRLRLDRVAGVDRVGVRVLLERRGEHRAGVRGLLAASGDPSLRGLDGVARGVALLGDGLLSRGVGEVLELGRERPTRARVRPERRLELPLERAELGRRGLDLGELSGRRVFGVGDRLQRRGVRLGVVCDPRLRAPLDAVDGLDHGIAFTGLLVATADRPHNREADDEPACSAKRHPLRVPEARRGREICWSSRTGRPGDKFPSRRNQMVGGIRRKTSCGHTG